MLGTTTVLLTVLNVKGFLKHCFLNVAILDKFSNFFS